MSTRVMLVDDHSDRASWLRTALHEAGFEVIALVQGMDDLHQCVLDHEPDVVIIESDSAKRDVLESICTRSNKYPKPVVLLSEHNDQKVLRTAQRAGISAYVVGGLSVAGVHSIINVAIAQFEQFQALRQQLAHTEQELVRQRLLERAKLLLMEQEGLSESMAYHQLRKAAMDSGKPIAEAARALLKLHGLV